MLTIGRCAIAVAAVIVARRSNPVLLCESMYVDAVLDDNRIRVTVSISAVLFQGVIFVLEKSGSVGATFD